MRSSILGAAPVLSARGVLVPELTASPASPTRLQSAEQSAGQEPGPGGPGSCGYRRRGFDTTAAALARFFGAGALSSSSSSSSSSGCAASAASWLMPPSAKPDSFLSAAFSSSSVCCSSFGGLGVTHRLRPGDQRAVGRHLVVLGALAGGNQARVHRRVVEVLFHDRLAFFDDAGDAVAVLAADLLVQAREHLLEPLRSAPVSLRDGSRTPAAAPVSSRPSPSWAALWSAASRRRTRRAVRR